MNLQGQRTGDRNVRFVVRGCLEQLGLGCLPVDDIVQEFQTVFQDAGFGFTIMGATGSACYCDGDMCNSDPFNLIQNSLVTCAFCTSTALPDPNLADINTDQNIVCERGTIDGTNVFEVSCPIDSGYSCETSVSDIVFFTQELGNVNAINTFRGCINGPQSGCLPSATIEENVRTALIASGLDVQSVSATDCYCSENNCNTVPISNAPQDLSCVSCFNLRVLDPGLGNLFPQLLNMNCENAIIDGTTVLNEACTGQSASCETIATTISASVQGFGAVNMILTFRGCSGIENLECVPPTTVQEGLETDLQAAGIDLSILSMTGSVCYCGNVACNMVPDSLLQGQTVACAYCLSEFFLDPDLADLNTDRNMQCEVGVVDNLNVLTATCPQDAGYSCVTSFSTVSFSSQTIGTFDLQGVSRSCIQAPSTGCAADFVDRLLMSPVDASLQITNAAGSQCYCATNNCNTQPLDATVPPTGEAISCLSCLSFDFGDPGLDADFRLVNCENGVVDGIQVTQENCLAADNRCVTISARVQSTEVPPFNAVLRTCASTANLGCSDASLLQNDLEVIFGFSTSSIVGDACYCQGNICNNVGVLPTTPGRAPQFVRTCPMDIVQPVANGVPGVTVSWLEPVAVDSTGSLVSNVFATHNPGEFFLRGVTVVTYVLTDSMGNQAVCFFSVTVQAPSDMDFIAPVITVPCPADITLTAPTGSTVNWVEPMATDNSGSVSTVSTFNPGDFFMPGTHIVMYTFSDPAGNSVSCSFLVNVESQAVSPFRFLVDCPADIVVTAPTGQNGVTVTWREPVVVDSQDNLVTTAGTANPMQVFPIGTSTVTYTYSDNQGNTDSCSFDVTVQGPAVDPFRFLVDCPADIVVTAPTGQNGVTVTWREPVVVDSQNNLVTVVGSSNPMQVFPIGTSTVTYTYSDNQGNSDSCSFDVTVQGPAVDPFRFLVDCPADIVVTAPTGQNGVTVTWREPVVVDSQDNLVNVVGSSNPMQVFPIGTSTVTYTYSDNQGNSDSCSFDVTVQGPAVDPFRFLVDCPADIVVTAPTGQNGVTVTWREPVVVDSQDNLVTVLGSANPLQVFPIGTSTITYTYSDNQGNSDSCSFDVTVQGPAVDPFRFLVDCPADIVVTAPTGQNGVTVTWREPVVVDSQDNLVTVLGSANPLQVFPIGTSTVTYTYSDNQGNSDSCSFDVTVQGPAVDPFRFLVDCPADIVVTAPTGQNGVTVTWREPVVVDSQDNLVTVVGSANPLQVFPIGTSTVTYTYSDNQGNSDSCSFDVTVQGPAVDPFRFLVDCPADIVVTAPTGQNGVTVTWREPVVVDSQDNLVTVLGSANPMQVFPIGTSTVTYTYSDNQGNSDSCSFDITVQAGVQPMDNTPPNIITPCPATRVVDVPAGLTGAPLFWTPPQAIDESGPVIVEATHRPGENFPLGVTLVVYTFTDQFGNSASCSFNIIVMGPQVMLQCPADSVVNVPAGVSRATVGWITPVAFNSNGQELTLQSTHEPNTVFQLGTTTVTYTVTGTPTSCSFDVIVQTLGGAPFRFLVDCPADIVVTAPTGQNGVTVTWREPIVVDSQDNLVTVLGSANPMQVFPIGTTTVTYTYSDNQGNIGSCSFDVTVQDQTIQDTTPPRITVPCPQDQTLIVASTTEQVFPRWIEPEAVDESGLPSVVTTHIPGSSFSLGNTEVTYTFADSFGNAVSCSFFIIVRTQTLDQIPPVITRPCPDDIVRFVAIGGMSDPITWLEPVAVDNSNEEPAMATTHRPGSTFPLGVTTVTYRFTDGAGNVASCMFQVSVIVDTDVRPPVISGCPMDQQVEAPIGSGGTTVFFNEPTATDESGRPLVTQTHRRGDFFPTGVTSVVFAFTDTNGNTATCSFFVTVTEAQPVDVLPPVIFNCPSGEEAFATQGATGVVVNFIAPTAIDNSGEAPSISASNMPGDFFPLGPTVVSYTFSDRQGNEATCTFVVAVSVETPIDRIPPTISGCQQLVQEVVPPGVGGTNVFFTPPTATDNSNLPVTVTSSRNSGDFFQLGATPVVFTFTDAAGNSNTCSFSVTVAVEDPGNFPEIVVGCPPDITATLAVNRDLAQVFWFQPQAVDRNGNQATTVGSHEPGSMFRAGFTTVTYTFTDFENNVAFCSFMVLVNENPCTFSPCLNDGFCLSNANSDMFTCACVGGYTGDLCEIPPRDVTPPDVFFCPLQPIVIDIPAGDLSTTVSWQIPMAIDDSQVTTTSNFQPGSNFQIGTTTVQYVFTDTSENQAFCFFDVVVTATIDTVSPIVTFCPGPITVNLSPGETSTTVTWLQPQATDPSGINVISNFESGDVFSPGSSEVRYIFIDGAGNQASCNFVVEVVMAQDNTPPTVSNCPNQPIRQTAPSGTDRVVVTWVTPTATDASGIINTDVNFQSGSVFTTGTTTIRYTFTDGFGNTAVCVFDVIVATSDNTPPTVSNCPNQPIRQTAPSGTSRVVVTWVTPTATDASGIINTDVNFQSGSLFTIGTTTIRYTFTDGFGNTAVCVFDVIVATSDNTPPTVSNCPNQPIRQTAPSGTSRVVVTWVTPTATDASGIINTDVNFQSGSVFTTGTTTIRYTFTDGFGNTAVCVFDVIVATSDNTPPTVSNCPIQPIRQTAPTGTSRVVVTWVTPTATDASGIINTDVNFQSGSVFTTGTTTIRYTFTDGFGNTAVCVFDVIVATSDNTPPTVSNCPNQPIRQTAPTGTSRVVVTWVTPTATDASGIINTDVNFQSGSVFTTGTTTIRYTFTDGFGNTAVCVFDVIVTTSDNTPPTVSNCPNQPIRQTAPTGTSRVVVTWVTPTATDASGIINTDVNFQSGSVFTTGTTTIRYTFTDGFGNTAVCVFDVIVTTSDNTPPTVSNCPNQPIRQTAPSGTSRVVVTWVTPTATDASGIINTDVNFQSGSVFTTGTTTIRYTFTDGFGNTAVCVFDVIVATSDNTPPTVSNCPNQPIRQTAPSGTSRVVVTWVTPTATDASGIINTDVNFQSGSLFTTGTTTIRYTFTDGFGNTAVCVFDVIVATSDNTPPTVSNCPNQPIRQTAPSGTSRVVVTWVTPTATDASGIINTDVNFQSGSFFTIGTTTIRYTFTDGFGNTAVCVFDVIVATSDNTPPTVSNCPNQPIRQTAPSGTSRVVVTWVTPTATDASGIINTDVNFQSGSLFTIGTTTIRYTFTDGFGNTAVCVFDVIVTTSDNTPPTVSNCPNQPIRQTAPSGTSRVVVTWVTPTATDASGIINTDVNFQSGSVFTTGTTAIRYTFTDGFGNTAVCVFDVIVTTSDNTPPTVSNCPNQPIRQTAPSGTSRVVVTWVTPTATDASGIINTDVNFQSGSLFTIGTTTIRYTFTDGFGNTAVCVFDVIVSATSTDTRPPTISGCPETIRVNAAMSATFVLVEWNEPTATDESGLVTVDGPPFPMQFLTVGTSSISYAFTDSAGNQAVCEFNIIISQGEDNIPPVISGCPNDITRTAAPGANGIVVSWTPPTATDPSGVDPPSVTNRPGTTFAVGTTQVVYTFIDGAGNSAFCSFVVIISPGEDNLPPVISGCPSDITRTAAPGTNGIVVSWTPPTATDPSGVDPPSVTNRPGTTFAVGTTQVVYTFFDGAGNPAFCSFVVNVLPGEDNIPPVISGCPSDITRTAAPGTNGVVVSWTPPTATDPSGVDPPSVTNRPGTSFTVGTTQVVYTFFDGAGNPAFCSFVVNVLPGEDNFPPVISGCPSDITRTAAPGANGVVVSWTPPTATDPSGVDPPSVTNRPGTTFTVGTTQVVYTFFDGAGNPAFCSFDVIVMSQDTLDTTPPVISGCPEDIVERLGQGMFAFVDWSRHPTAVDDSGLVPDRSGPPAPSGFFGTGETEVIYTFTDNAGNVATCAFIISVTVSEDNIPPVISGCPNDITRTAAPGTNGIVVSWTPPTATDPSGVDPPSVTNRPGTTFAVGTTQVVYTFIDGAGNSAFCSFVVDVLTGEDNMPPVISGCPSDITRTAAPGANGIVVSWTPPTATDPSGVDPPSVTNRPGTTFTVGTTQVVYTFFDGAGNPAFCSFVVNVLPGEDNIPPVISGCPSDITRTAAPGANGIVVSWTPPTATDPSGVDPPLVNNRPGTTFAVGTTQVVYTFIDGAGNPAFCSFVVNVLTGEDNIPPVISGCPSDITRTAAPGANGIVVSWTPPTATDPSGVDPPSVTNRPGTTFTVGTTQVVYTFFDGAGNPAFCSFVVNVLPGEDNVPPVISGCPSDITRTAAPGTNGVVVSWTPPTATDPSGVDPPSVTNRPGTTFTVGTTQVVYTFFDGAGNPAFCSFDVIVMSQDTLDTTPPVISGCPEDIVERLGQGMFAFVDWSRHPTAVDDSGLVPDRSGPPAPSGFFGTGETEVIYTFTDNAGNVATCAFIISVTVSEDNIPPVISGCPSDITRTAALGTNGIVVSWTPPTATDPSGVDPPSVTNRPGTTFAVGTTQVVYTFIDGAGNSAFCSFVVNVLPGEDNIPPVISGCPSDITRTAAPGTNGVVVSWTPPTATDPSGVDPPSVTNRPGTTFAVGTTQVVYTFFDGAGNPAFCSFVVNVLPGEDNIPPVISGCPSDITRTAAPGTNGIVVSWTPPTATDPSGVDPPSVNNRPGTTFTVGTTQVVYTFFDGAGNPAFCSFVVNVLPGEDNIPPVISGCPSDITRTAAPGANGIVVSWTPPTATDPSGVDPPSVNNRPGTTFTVGTTQVVYTFFDGAGNPAFCSFVVNVLPGADQQLELIDCPANIVQPAAPGIMFQTVTWTEPSARTSTGLILEPTSGPAIPQGFFRLGTSNIVYNFTSGTVSIACTFDITVVAEAVDNTPPLISGCPNDITRTAAPGTSGIVVSWTPPTATDPSGVDPPSVTNRPGTTFTVGTTQVVYTFFDGAGNPAFCSFVVNVLPGEDNIPPVISGCPSDITRTAAPGTNGIVVSWTPPTATDPSGVDPPSVNNRPGTTFTVGTTQVVYTFFDGAGNPAFCSFVVIISPGEDNLPPVISGCPSDITRTAAPGANVTVVSWTPPTATDPSGVDPPSVTNRPGTTFTVGTTQVVYTFFDGAGNPAFCSFVVNVLPGEDNIPPVISGCPSDITRTAAPGTSGIVVSWTPPTATDPSGVDPPSVTNRPGNTFAVGTTQVVYTFLDGAGNPAFCSFVVNVLPGSSLTCLVCTSYSYRDSSLAQQNIDLQDLDCENGIVNGGSVTVEECMSNADSCVTIAMDIIGTGSNGLPIRSVIRACAQSPSLSCIAPSGAISFFLAMELNVNIESVEGQMCYCADRSTCNNAPIMDSLMTP
ncbi:uncharacterized protein [Apostichopus japonicus]|uniref:uncharacterized protein isoform X3 n=1 Tax=Stichopus japonicus TaxID=307972 RepID=UPI003AB781D9